MEIAFLGLLKAFILPPGSIAFGAATGVLVRRRYKRFGQALIFASVLGGLLLCLPIVAGQIARVTERYPPIPPAEITAIDADLVVILAGGKDHNRLEYGGVTVSKNTLERIRYGAVLARALDLPILVSGGSVLGDGVPEAKLMADVLKNDYGITPQWIEDESRNTAQNAAFTAAIVGSKKIILVTNALHMWRAVNSFSAAGIPLVPASVASVAPGEPLRVSYYDFLPSQKALMVSRDALHELIGIVWYEVRY